MNGEYGHGAELPRSKKRENERFAGPRGRCCARRRPGRIPRRDDRAADSRGLAGGGDPRRAPRRGSAVRGNPKGVWQAPPGSRRWIGAYGARRAYAAWGALFGSGVATIVPHSAYLVLLAAEFVSGPKAGALAGAAFGLTRGLVAVVLARSRGPSAQIADVLPRAQALAARREPGRGGPWRPGPAGSDRPVSRYGGRGRRREAVLTSSASGHSPASGR